MAKLKIVGYDNLLELPNSKASEIKKIWLDETIPNNQPIDLGVMTVTKSSIRGVYFDVKEPLKFNHYDFSNEAWRQSVLDFEIEFNNFDGGFDKFQIARGAVDEKGTILNLGLYEELNKKLNALNYLRYLRKKAQQHEAEANKDLEIDVSKINFGLESTN